MSIEITVRKGATVTIPSTGDDWELYTCTKKCGVAAKGMTAALKKAITAAKRALAKPPYTQERITKALSEAYRAHLDPAENKYSNFGAADSEPIFQGKNALIRAISVFIYGDAGRLREDGFDTWSF
jgi:hypothetical protein